MICACSDRQLYTEAQNRERVNCMNLQGDAYKQCLQRTSKSYDQYKRERDELLKDGK